MSIYGDFALPPASVLRKQNSFLNNFPRRSKTALKNCIARGKTTLLPKRHLNNRIARGKTTLLPKRTPFGETIRLSQER